MMCISVHAVLFILHLLYQLFMPVHAAYSVHVSYAVHVVYAVHAVHALHTVFAAMRSVHFVGVYSLPYMLHKL